MQRPPGETNVHEHSILIVDDDHDLTEVLATRCRSLGLAVDTACDAMMAIRKIDDHRPDLVVMDYRMPGGNGMAVREIMFDHEALVSIPVIMLTGDGAEETIRRCHELCAYYVPKGPEMWLQLEPLLLELLQLADGKAQPQTDTKFQELVPVIPPDPGQATRRLAESLATIDRVFSLLGWNEPYLPTVDASQTEQQGDVRPLQEITRPWVLIIDDDSDFSFSLKIRLEREGLDVLRACAGMEGYRYAFLSECQLIVLDYEMPDGCGDYVLRRLKENPVTRDIPVIVLTGKRNKTLERTMYNLGAAAYFTKPYTWDSFWPELRLHLDEPQSNRISPTPAP